MMKAKTKTKHPFKECEQSKGDCGNCEYEGCDYWGIGYEDTGWVDEEGKSDKNW